MNKVYCKNCMFGKLNRHLNSNQLLSVALADCLLDGHKPSRREKQRMKEEVVREFCKKGKINLNNDCSSYKHRWWKFWIKKATTKS